MNNIEKFEYIASRYDTPERVEMAKIIANTIRTYVVNGKNKSVIDYGCGTGLVGLELSDVFCSILFIDASNNMVEQVRQKIERLLDHSLRVLCCDFLKELPSDLHADYIILAQTLLHVKDVELLLSRLYAVLNTGGHLFIIDFDKNDTIISEEVHNGFDQKELIRTLKKIGFTRFKSQTFYHGEKIFMKKDASLFIIDSEK